MSGDDIGAAIAEAAAGELHDAPETDVIFKNEDEITDVEAAEAERFAAYMAANMRLAIEDNFGRKWRISHVTFEEV